ncbi:MAG TPA: PP2C family serine/threonine-protein phosphatase [Pseudomonadota bacterium]|nr:PP2C family serine/threonine-protein phosphatase [Pseudomonadota bacterium]
MSGNDPSAGPGGVPWVSTGCVTGARHLREGKVCQDAVLAVRQGDFVATAVADGHGTCKFGDIGANRAVEVAVSMLLQFAAGVHAQHPVELRSVHQYAEHPLRIQITREWASRVREHAASPDAELAPYGSTLLFALATPAFLLMGQLGDGDILLVDAAGAVSRPIATDARNFAEETASLCQNEPWLEIRLRTIPSPDTEALLLMSTDGYSKSYATDALFETIGSDYRDLFREHQDTGVTSQLPGFLREVTTQGSGDDIALSMLYWPKSAGVPPQDGDAPQGTTREELKP